MCGRYTRKAAAKVIYSHFGIDPDEEFTDIRIEPSWDIAPGSEQPVCIETEQGRELAVMRWGFKLPDRLLFNTKSEGVAASKFWSSRIGQRCIVPASTFFEWQKVKGKTGTKYEISVPGRELFGFAGLWGNWANAKTRSMEPTFSIFTSEPNANMLAIHDRQPIVLEPKDYEEWLAPSERPPLHLLRILPEERMNIVRVAPLETKCPAQGSLFGEESE